MPEGTFLEQVRQFWALTLTHALVMFPYITIPPFLISPLLQTFAQDGARRRLLEKSDSGFWSAVWLGICSPPGRSKIFREAAGLLAAGVSPSAVIAYLISAHSLLVYFAFLIAALNGPQPVLGLALGALLSMGLLRWVLGRMGAEAWDAPRREARGVHVEAGDPSAPGVVHRLLKTFLGDLASLWWPLVLGSFLGAVVAAWGLTDVFFSIQGSHGVFEQIGSTVVGLLLAYVSGVPPVGNVYLAGWLWKAEFFTYAGLMAFYLGVLVTPFALPRYAELFGRELGWKVVRRIAAVVLVSALAVTAFWYGLDAILHAVGLAEPIESLMDSTIEPSAVPWFHTLFWAEHAH